MSVQNQDLVFHRDNSLISDHVLDQETHSYLSIISHEQGTSPTWIINSLIENALVGSSTLVNSELKRVRNNTKRSTVYFISFLHPKEYYNANCVKNGIDLASMDNFVFIDCFTNLFTEIIPDTTSINAFKSFKSFVQEKVISQIKDPKSVIFVESPEFILNATEITANELLSQLNRLNKLCKQLFVISGHDYPQSIDLHNTNPVDPVFKVSDFLAKLYYKSQLNVNLMPLPTGRAKDITGCLTISKGLIPYVGKDTNVQVLEREYIYLVTKESNVKLFFR